MVLGGFTGSEVATKTEEVPYVYSDINIGFVPNLFLTAQGISGDIVRAFDQNSINQSLRQIVLTSYHERPFRPSFGVGARKYLFENFDEFELYDFEINIRDQIERYEPRVVLKSVVAEPVEDRGGGHAAVTISYEYVPLVGDSRESAEVRITSERVR